MNFPSSYDCYKKQWKNKNITCFFKLGLNYNIILHDPFPDYLSQDNLLERKEKYCFTNFTLCTFIMCGYIWTSESSHPGQSNFTVLQEATHRVQHYGVTKMKASQQRPVTISESTYPQCG